MLFHWLSERNEMTKGHFKALALRAAFGDIYAMQRLGEWFRSQVSAEYLKLEAAWESTPGEKNRELAAYFGQHKGEALYARAGIMWHLRAAAYGNEQSEKLLLAHPYWGNLSLIPERFFYPGVRMCLQISGKTMRKAGFFGFKEKETYCISSFTSEGVYCAETEGGEEGPDEDGFGREELYHFYRFDEFFHQIGCLRDYSRRDFSYAEGKFAENCKREKEALEKQREEFWKGSRRPEGARPYAWSLAECRVPQIRNGVLIFYGGGERNYMIPPQITVIGENGFSGNTALEEVLVPDHVQAIEEQAFCSCRGLKHIRLPDHLTMLGRGLCMDSRQLESVHLPENLTEVPDKMFQYCKAIRGIVLPENIRRIGESAFSYCGVEEILIPKGLEEMGVDAFASSQIRKIRIPGNTKLGKEAFRQCSNLKEVVIEEGIRELPKGIFGYCKKLEHVELPATLEKMDCYAFSGCSSLKEIYIPESVTYISYSVFPDEIMIYGVPGSTAEEYAREYKLRFTGVRDRGKTHRVGGIR